MPLDNIQPLADLAADKNVAIQTLSTMLNVTYGVIGVLCGVIVAIVKWFLAANKEAWGYVSENSKAFNKFVEKVTYALGQADAANDDRANKSRGRHEPE